MIRISIVVVACWKETTSVQMHKSEMNPLDFEQFSYNFCLKEQEIAEECVLFFEETGVYSREINRYTPF